MTFKCKMCDEPLVIANDNVVTCGYCGTRQTLPKLNSDRKAALYERAGLFRRNNEYDKAAAIYETILKLNEGSSDAESYWSVVLCKYGVEYTEDPITRRRSPTCNRVHLTSIFDDEDYKKTIEHSDDITRSLYEEEAQAIDEVQKRFLEISDKEEPFDIFICYKEKDDDAQRTKDSFIAQDIYEQLRNEGYRVFFSRITLENKHAYQYKACTFAALNSAKIMLVIGTKPEHFNAVWVKNEWSHFLALAKNDKSRTLIPCFRDMDAYDLPEALTKLQGQDINKLGFMQDLLRVAEKIKQKTAPTPAPGSESVSALDLEKSADGNKPATTITAPGVEPLYKRAILFLEDGNFDQAREYCEKLLDIDPEYAPAYIGKLCADLGIRNEEELMNYEKPLDDMLNYQRALRFAAADYYVVVERYNKTIIERTQKTQESVREEQERVAKFQGHISAGLRADHGHTVGLKSNGTVLAVGFDDNGQCNVSEWRGIISVSAGGSHTVGLKTGGMAIAVGNNRDYRCNVGNWRDLVAISAGGSHTVGLKNDGTVVAVGLNDDGECDVSEWRNIVAISAGGRHTVGLKSNGTVVAVGNNRDNRCNVSDWRNIVAVAAGINRTIGLRADGRVVAIGDDQNNLCDLDDWRDIIAVAAGVNHTVGLKIGGTVIAAGSNNSGECDVSSWRDIVAITAGASYSIGLRADGTVLVRGENSYGKCNVGNWRSIGPVSEEERLQRAQEDQRELEERHRQEQEVRRKREEKLRHEEIQRRMEQSRRWKAQGLCERCGGEIGGFFTKKCKSCGE